MSLKDLIVRGPKPRAQKRPRPSSVRLSEAKKPYHLDADTWLYEEKRGLLVVHDIQVDGKHVRTEQHHIPWAKIRWALRRRDYVQMYGPQS